MLSFILLQTPHTDNNSMYQAILIGGMMLVFYFFMIRPQQKRKKEQYVFLEKLKKGEHIITIGGIHGKVHAVADNTLTLEIDNKGAKITVAKDAISMDATRRHLQNQ